MGANTEDAVNVTLCVVWWPNQRCCDNGDDG